MKTNVELIEASKKALSVLRQLHNTPLVEIFRTYMKLKAAIEKAEKESK